MGFPFWAPFTPVPEGSDSPIALRNSRGDRGGMPPRRSEPDSSMPPFGSAESAPAS